MAEIGNVPRKLDIPKRPDAPRPMPHAREGTGVPERGEVPKKVDIPKPGRGGVLGTPAVSPSTAVPALKFGKAVLSGDKAYQEEAIRSAAELAARALVQQAPVVGKIPGVGKAAGKIAGKEASFLWRHKGLSIATGLIALIPIFGIMIAFPMLMFLLIWSFLED